MKTCSPMSSHTHPHQRGFCVGSPGYDQQVYALAGHSNRTYATGATSTAQSYGNSSSVWLPVPVFAYHPTPGQPSRYSELDKFGSLSIASNAPPPLQPYLNPSSYNYLATINQYPAPPSNMAVTLPATSQRPSRPTRQSANLSRLRDLSPATSSSSPQADPQTPEPQNDAGPSEAASAYGAAEKKNPCWMCHKSFDRPSTLKKHMLVHTGERAHVCPTCERRFGVASNLNRHMKICARKAETEQSSSDGSEPSSSVGPSGPSEAGGSAQALPARSSEAEPSAPSPTPARSVGSRGRKRTSPPVSSLESADESAATQRPKRRRRAPSPSTWIPESLRGFDLTPIVKATPVPLPPVQPFEDPRTHVVEERDSFDDHVSAAPYHPDGWNGKLPGPALLMQESMGTMGGRLLVF